MDTATTATTSPSKSLPPDASGVSKIAKTQPLLTLSGLGLAYGSLISALKKVKRITKISPFRLPSLPKAVPRYMKSNYVKYPALFIVLWATVRRVRAT